VAERVAVYNLWVKREARKAMRDHLQAMARNPAERQPLSLEFPTVEEWLAVELPVLKSDLASRAQAALLPEANPAEQKILPFPVVTRVENQFGGRVPEQMKTVGEIRRSVVEFNPFARMRLMGSAVPAGLFDRSPDGAYRLSVMQWCTGMYIYQNWKAEGAAQMRATLNRDRNFARLMNSLLEFLPAEAGGEPGITEPELYERYRSSICRQLAA
jgi:hypothetical protein